MKYEVISFDCYGTLVDWKKGVLNELVNLFEEFQIDITKEENHLHCAQSLYHDIIPCNQLGINNVWINRYNEMLPENTIGMVGKELKSLIGLRDYLL